MTAAVLGSVVAVLLLGLEGELHLDLQLDPAWSAPH